MEESSKKSETYMLDRTTLQLFGKFPREVGVPARSTVTTLKQFENFISTNNGVFDLYTSLYPTSGDIDKVSFDSDGKRALGESKQLFRYLISKEYKTVIVASGKKGYHIHVFLKVIKTTTTTGKELLFNATLRLLEEVFGVNDKNEFNCSSFDTHIFGDIRRIFRIPNTLRPPENHNWCTFLPPDTFLDMTEEDIARHIKTPQSYSYSGNNLPTLTDFPKTTVRAKSDTLPFTDNIQLTKASLLKNILPSYLFKYISLPNPSHKIRVATTVYLLDFFSPEEIADFYSTLSWDDWDWEKTLYQINHCKGLRSYFSESKQVVLSN